MSNISLRQRLAQKYRRQIYKTAVQPTQEELACPAIVFAPHQDDETLGCGGTISKKKAAGAQMKIVFMTDGRNSHPHFQHLISGDVLAQKRQDEAIQAARILGIDSQEIKFLGFEDGNLVDSSREACQVVQKILTESKVEQIFLPSPQDPLSDHIATNKIVLTALRASGLDQVNVYEYAIWSWHQWPFTNPFGTTRFNSRKNVMAQAITSGFGLKLVLVHNFAVDIRNYLAQKRTALEAHESQLTRLIPNPDWKTLHDVSEGEFIECFFQDYELFKEVYI